MNPDQVRGERDAYDDLCAYTLARGDMEFVHQHVELLRQHGILW